MEPDQTTIRQLREQELALSDQIARLEETVAASSTAGIREFRRTRMRQLDVLRAALADRLRRLAASPEPAVEAYMLGAAYRDATLVAQGTFGR